MDKFIKHKYLYIFLLSIISILQGCTTIKLNLYNFETKEEDWTIPGGSNQRDNISKSQYKISNNPTLLWYYNSDAGYPKYPITVSNSIIFTSNLEGYITLSDIYTGSKIGSLYANPKSITSAPIIKKNCMIFTTNGYKGNFIGNYNLIEGKYNWIKQIPRCETLLLVENDFIIVATVKGDIFKMNFETGDLIWNAKTKNQSENFLSFFSSPALFNNFIFIGNDNGNLYKINANTGEIIKSINIGSVINSDISIYNNKIFFSANNNIFYCCDEELNIIWKKDLNTKTSNSNCFDSNKIFIAAINGVVFCLNILDGNEIWSFRTGGTITASPIIQKDKIFIGSFDKFIYCLNKNNGELIWRYELDGRIRGGIVIWKDYIIATSDDKNIYCFK